MKTPLLEDFKKLLESVLEKQGLTYQDLVDKIGWHRNRLGKYLSGERGIGLPEIEEIAKALGVKPHALISDKEIEPIVLKPSPGEALEMLKDILDSYEKIPHWLRNDLEQKDKKSLQGLFDILKVFAALDDSQKAAAIQFMEALGRGLSASSAIDDDQKKSK
jgi:transcriptional regulator with XRE-family HTH domain